MTGTTVVVSEAGGGSGVGHANHESSANVSDWVQAGEDFSIDTIHPQCGWIASKTVPPDEWKPVDEPNLAERIQDVPNLKLQDVAPPPER